MDARYRSRWPELKAAIVARVAAGERLKGVCADEGMPTASAVLRWRRADPGFDAELSRAMRRGAERRRAYDPAVARELLRRLREGGETLGQVLRDPAMPSRRTLWLWQGADPAFAEALHAHRLQMAGNRALRLRGRFRPFDQDVADRIVVGLNKGVGLRALLNGDPTLPSAAVVARWRRERREFDAVVRRVQRVWTRRRAAGRLFTEDLETAVLHALVEGHTFASLEREPWAPCRKTLAKWVRTRPQFAEAVALACDLRDDRIADEVFEMEMAGGREARAITGPMKRQLVRLRHRPGTRHRKRQPPAQA